MNTKQLTVLNTVIAAKKADFKTATANGGNGITILALVRKGQLEMKVDKAGVKTWTATTQGKAAAKAAAKAAK